MAQENWRNKAEKPIKIKKEPRNTTRWYIEYRLHR